MEKRKAGERGRNRGMVSRRKFATASVRIKDLLTRFGDGTPGGRGVDVALGVNSGGKKSLGNWSDFLRKKGYGRIDFSACHHELSGYQKCQHKGKTNKKKKEESFWKGSNNLGGKNIYPPTDVCRRTRTEKNKCAARINEKGRKTHVGRAGEEKRRGAKKEGKKNKEGPEKRSETCHN